MNTAYLNSRVLFVSVCLLLSIALAAACAPVMPAEVNAQTAQAEPDMEAITTAITTIFDEYASSLEDSDAERWAALWAEDGVQSPPGSPINDGLEVIAGGVAAELEEIVYEDMTIEVDEVLAAGDYAIARGLFTATFAPIGGGDSVFVDGKYTTTFQKQADGSWKIYRDIYNTNAAPASPEAANAELSAQLHGRFSENNLEGALELADDDIEMIAYGLGLDLKGKDQFMGFMQARKRAFPDITVEHTNVVADGDQVAVEFVATGTHTGPLMTPNGEIAPTGKPVELHVIEVHTWRDGKLVKVVQYQDPTSVLRQIGVMN